MTTSRRDFLRDTGVLLGAAAIGGHATEATAAAGGVTTQFPKPPQPLAKLRIVMLQPSGRQSVSGAGDEDLLLVHPAQEVTQSFKLDVTGFRGIYYIGASFDVAPLGTLVTPNRKTVGGIGSLLRLATHRAPVSRPFIYLSRFRVKSTKINFGDLFEIGGGAPVGAWGGWPDLYRSKMKIDGVPGWPNYMGGSFSSGVQKSDGFKADTGGWRHSFIANVDISWGYQTEFLVPSWAVNMKPYAGPDGFGENHFWNYCCRLITNPANATDSSPVAFFMARGSSYIPGGEYYSNYFHEGAGQGNGVFVIPVGGKGSIKNAHMPREGAFGAKDYGTHLAWPQTGYPKGRAPVAIGRIINGAVVKPPAMVSESEVGWQRRVTSRAALLAEIG